MTHPIITTSKGRYVLVEVPEEGKLVGFDIKARKIIDYGNIDLPSGSTYTFLFTTKQATEEDWEPLVQYEINPMDDFIEGYLDYERGEPWYTKDTATESGLSLQKANGIDVNKNWAVIKID